MGVEKKKNVWEGVPKGVLRGNTNVREGRSTAWRGRSRAWRNTASKEMFKRSLEKISLKQGKEERDLLAQRSLCRCEKEQNAEEKRGDLRRRQLYRGDQKAVNRSLRVETFWRGVEGWYYRKGRGIRMSLKRKAHPTEGGGNVRKTAKKGDIGRIRHL